MAHRKTRKGDRRWFGKKDAKQDGNVARRQDDKIAARQDVIGGLASSSAGLPGGQHTLLEEALLDWLWQIFVATGADTDGDTDWQGRVTGELGEVRFARHVLANVTDLMATYNEALDEMSALESKLNRLSTELGKVTQAATDEANARDRWWRGVQQRLDQIEAKVDGAT